MMSIEEEREKIISVCHDVAKNCTIIAIGVYGSRVSGYARKDSDYDVLLILVV